MREFTASLKDMLLKGIQPDKVGFNPQGLLECTNLIAEPNFLRGMEEVSDYLPSLPTTQGVNGYSWPFPQLFRGKMWNLLCYDTAVYSFLEDNLPSNDSQWEAVRLTIYDYMDVAVEKTIPTTDEPWRFVDFGPTFYLVRSDMIIMRLQTEGLFDPSGSLGHGDDFYLAVDDVNFNCATRHRGRMVMGGLNNGNLLLDAWNTLFNNYLPTLPESFETVANLMANGVGQNSVMWSSIGGGDTYFWFFPTLALNGILPSYINGGVDWPPFFDYLKRNEWGTRTMESQGAVLEVKSLGKDIVVYSDDAIHVLEQTSSPFPTFGLTKVASIGLAVAGAVGGDDRRHVFVGADEALYSFSSNGLEKLDYEWELSGNDFIDHPIRVHFDGYDNRYYINGGAGGIYNYCLSTSGLTRMLAHAPLITAVNDGASFKGVTVDLTADTNFDDTYIQTDWFNLGSMDYKTLTQVAVEFKAPNTTELTLSCDIHWMSEDGTTGSITSINMGRVGFTRPYITAVAFRIKVVFDAASGATDNPWVDLRIDDLEVSYQQSDKRFRRSINVGQAVG